MNPGGNYGYYGAGMYYPPPSNNPGGGGEGFNGNGAARGRRGAGGGGFVSFAPGHADVVNIFACPTINNFYGVGGNYPRTQQHVPRNFQERVDARYPSLLPDLSDILEHPSFAQDHGHDWLDQQDPNKNKDDKDEDVFGGLNQNSLVNGQIGASGAAPEIPFQPPTAFVNPFQVDGQVMRSPPPSYRTAVSSSAPSTGGRLRGTRGRRATRSSTRSSTTNNTANNSF